MSESRLEIKLDRSDRVYHPNDIIRGVVVVHANKGWSHSGVVLEAAGEIHTLVTRSGIVGTSEKSETSLVFKQIDELVPAGTMAGGSHELPFEFQLIGSERGGEILESYHGVYISVIYSVSVSCDRGMLKKSLKKEVEFIVEINNAGNTADTDGGLAEFNITPTTLNIMDRVQLESIPDFKISGKMHRTLCDINSPFTGELNIELSIAQVRSIELQLARIESVSGPKNNGAVHQDASEVQKIQIGEGNVCRDVVVPIYMVFPRLYSCPTYKCSMFKIEFEINLIIVFDDGHVVTENFPINIFRGHS